MRPDSEHPLSNVRLLLILPKGKRPIANENSIQTILCDQIPLEITKNRLKREQDVLVKHYAPNSNKV